MTQLQTTYNKDIVINLQAILAFFMSNFRLDFLRGVSLKSCSRNRAVKLIVFLWPLQGSISLVVSNNQVFSK